MSTTYACFNSILNLAKASLEFISVFYDHRRLKKNFYKGEPDFSLIEEFNITFFLHKLVLIFTCLQIFGFLVETKANPKITIVWATTTQDGSYELLKDIENNPLNAGVRGNGDGDLVELGYFSNGSAINPFAGDWIPLTSNTHVGDSSSGYGFGNGMFSFTTNFELNQDNVVVYPTEPKEFEFFPGFTITSSTPPTGVPICIRFYDKPTKGGANYNTVTGSEWLWPSFPNGSSIPSNHYYKITEGVSTWKTGAIFEDSENRYKTSLSPTYSIITAESQFSLGNGTFTDINSSYLWGTEISLQANPGPHSIFNYWTGSGIAEPWNENTTLIVDGSQTVYAEFSLIPYVLTLNVQGNGEVMGDGSFSFGDTVSISALPNLGHSFSHWEWESNGSHYSSNQNETIMIDSDMDLVAVFTRNTYDVLIGAELGGSYVILDQNGSTPTTIEHGFQYTLRSIPDKHFGFNNWISTDAGIAMLGNENSAQTTFIPTADVNFTASFSELSYQLDIESTQGFKTLSSSGEFPATSMVTVEVEMQDGFVFDYWQDPMAILANPNSAQTEANISKIYPHESATVSAILRLDDYDDSDINITSGTGGNAFFNSDESGGFTHYTSYELNATAQLGYQFDQWVGNTEQLEYGPFEKQNKFLVEGPLSLSATFIYTEYNLELESAGDGTVLGPETFTIEDNPTIRASAFPGARFTHWTGDTEYLLNHLSAETFIHLDNNSIPQDLHLVANFVPESYQVVVQTEGNGSVDILLSSGEIIYETVYSSVSIDSETQLTLDASPQDGWSFSHWRGLPDISDLLNPIAEIDQYSAVSYFYPSSDLNLTAEFKVTEYDDTQIVVTSSTGGVVSVGSETSGNFLHFSSYDLNASPNKGYEFDAWEVESTKESLVLNGLGVADNQIRIMGDMEINASFNLIQYEIAMNVVEGGQTQAPTHFSVLDNPVITASESPGWDFSHWSGDTQYLADPNASQTTINHASLPLKNLTFTANFIREIYHISLSTEGSGSFDLSQDGEQYLSDSTGTDEDVDSATRLGADAQPSPGWFFSQWFGLPNPANLRDSSPSLDPFSASIHFIPVGDVNISAKFERQNYSLNIIHQDIGGSALGEGTYPFETLVDINASPQPHYQFQSWHGDNSHLLFDTTFANNQLIIPSSNITIEPVFVPKIYSVNTYPDENGTFSISGTYNNITKLDQIEYNATSNLSLSALPLDSDNHMLNYLYWENTLGESGYSYSSTINIPFLDANYSFWAYFTERNEVGYSLISSPPYAGSAGENVSYSSAQFQRLVANPNPGYNFIGWEAKTGEVFSPHWSVLSVDVELEETSEIWAYFEQQTRLLSLQYNEDQGEVIGFSNEVDYGTNLTLTADPDDNYTFVGWDLIKDINFHIGREQSAVHPAETKLFINNQESPELSLIRGFTYHFDCNLSSGDEFFLSTSSDSNDTDSHYLSGISGHLSSTGILTFAVPTDAPDLLYYHASGESFSGNRIKIHSIEDSALLPTPTNPVFSNRITHHFGLRANFERTRHTISINAEGQGTVSLSEQDVYFWGDEVAISATAEDHWYFSHWDGSTRIENDEATETTLQVVEDSEIRAVFKKQQYGVDVNASPTEFGLINTQNETFTYGEYVSLTASPLVGKQFDEWVSLENLSLDDPADRFNPTANFKVLGNAKAQANFSKIVLNLDISFYSLDQNNEEINGDIGASVSHPDIIYHGDSVTLTLTPFSGYSFLYWVDLDSGEILTTQKIYSSVMTSDRNLQAVLRKHYYQLEVSSTQGGLSQINTVSPYYWGDQVSLQATPNEHWEFYRWTGIGSEHLDNISSPSALLTIRKDSEITAEFQPKGYTLEISVNPEGYGGFSTIENSYTFDEIAQIEALPRTGKLFDSWSINANASFTNDSNTTTNPADFIITGNARLTANFKSKQYNVTRQVVVVDDNDAIIPGVFGGRILGGQTFEDEDIAEFVISLSNGYKLDHWRDEDHPEVELSSEKLYKHKMLSDLNLTAVVTERKYEIDVEISPSIGGFAQINEDIASDYKQFDGFAYGSEINASAYAEDGYRFVKWGVTGVNIGTPTQTDQTFTVANDIKLTAYFAPTGLVNLQLSSNPTDAVSYLYGGGSFEYDPNHAILALPKQGYLFSHWDYNGSEAVGIVNDPYSSTTSIPLDGDKALTAVFIIDENNPPSNEDSNKLYLLSVYSNNSIRGTTSGSGFFRGVRTINAFAKEGFEFSHWEGSTFANAYDATTEVSVFENTSVVAHFQSVGVFEDSESLENGWWGNPWFGNFWKVGEEDWLFHEKLGWIYMKKKGDQSIWVWIQKMEDWFWTAKEHYPYLHSSSLQSWYFVNLEKTNFTRLVIFDYANSEWLSK